MSVDTAGCCDVLRMWFEVDEAGFGVHFERFGTRSAQWRGCDGEDALEWGSRRCVGFGDVERARVGADVSMWSEALGMWPSLVKALD